MPVLQRTIKGQPYLDGSTLRQDQILLITSDGKRVQEASGTITLVPDIWIDLKKSSGGSWKRRKNYFYWEVDVTDTSDDSMSGTIKVEYECPRPTPEFFGYDYTSNPGDSEWMKYWKTRFQTTAQSPYVGSGAMFRREVILPGTKYIKFGRALHRGQDEAIQDPDGNWTSEEIKVPEAKVDLDDTMNLLSATRPGESAGDLGDLAGLLGGML